MCSIIMRLHVRDFVITWTFHPEVNNGASAVPYTPCFYTIVLSLMWEGGLYLIAQLVLVIHPHMQRVITSVQMNKTNTSHLHGYS